MKIVVLDGYTLNPGDLSWAGLEALGECEVHERSAPDEVIPRAAGAGAILVNKITVSAETMDRLSELRYIGVTATGYNIVDADAARSRQIAVTNVPTYGTRSVAQMVFAHLLNLTQHAAHHAETVRQGRWSTSEDFCYWDFPLIELAGLTMGIVGYGRIGRTTGELAHAFGMNVLAYDAMPEATETAPDYVQTSSLDDLFAQSDVVSLHCPLTPATERLVDAGRLAMMKPTAFLINTSRGPLIDEPALADALKAGQLAGAGLDVLSVEPPHPGDTGSALSKAPNCFVTPHIAWATRSARARLMKTAVENLRAFLDGQPQNVVN